MLMRSQSNLIDPIPNQAQVVTKADKRRSLTLKCANVSRRHTLLLDAMSTREWDPVLFADRSNRGPCRP